MEIMFKCLDQLFGILNSRYGHKIREILCFSKYYSLIQDTETKHERFCVSQNIEYDLIYVNQLRIIQS
jgi:hypothetical protein